MEKLLSGTITHAFGNKNLYAVILPEVGYFLFKTNGAITLSVGDGIAFYKTFEKQSMYHISTGQSFPAIIGFIVLSDEEVRRIGLAMVTDKKV